MLSLYYCTVILLLVTHSLSLPIGRRIQQRDVPDFVRRYGMYFHPNHTQNHNPLHLQTDPPPLSSRRIPLRHREILPLRLDHPPRQLPPGHRIGKSNSLHWAPIPHQPQHPHHQPQLQLQLRPNRHLHHLQHWHPLPPLLVPRHKTLS